MANYITTSIEWAGKETLEFFFSPNFIGKDPMDTQGVRIIPNVQSVQKLNFISQNGKITKAYAQGFTGTQAESYTQRSLTVYQMKAEKEQDANEFYQTVLEQVQAKGYQWNDVKASAGGIINEIVMTPFLNAMKADMFRIFWLADTAKQTITNGIYDGTADADYNAFDGMLKLLIDNAATSPTASQFKKVAMAHAAVAQVDTHTFTGTTGTVSVTVNGTAYVSAAFDTSLTVTCAAFVATHATALALLDVVATSSGAKVTLTSSRAGRPFLSVAADNVAGDLAGSKAATTATTAPAALATDEAIGYFKSLYETADINLRKLPRTEKVFLVDDDTYYNLEDTLDTDGTEIARQLLADGTVVLKYKGITVMNLGWNEYLDADFPAGYPNIIIYTSNQNLVLGLDTTDESAMIEEWYNSDLQLNRWRSQYKMGANYVHAAYTAIAF